LHTCYTELKNSCIAWRAGNAEHLVEISAKQRDVAEQECQLYAALRTLGHALAPPQRDPLTGAAPTTSEAGGGMDRAASSGGVSMSRASSSSVREAATADAFWELLKKVDDIAPHVPHSELLLAAKADGLLRLGK
jgi:hypothetical protein